MVLILLDDFSTELVDYMDALQAIGTDGISFDHYFDSNPLCCPSRTGILTGRYAHNTGVHDNFWPDGGFGAFLENGLERRTTGVYLQAAGYHTGFIGKFLNGYRPSGAAGTATGPSYPPNYVPPGWDEWFATGDAYQSFNYVIAQKNAAGAQRVQFDGGAEVDYSTDVFAGQAESFIAANTGHPFFLSINPFAVHNNAPTHPDPDVVNPPRYPPAPRDRAASSGRPIDWSAPEYPDGGDCGLPRGGCAEVEFPRPDWRDAFNAKPTAAPAWYGPVVLASTTGVANLRALEIERIQMAQSADDLIGRVRSALSATGELDSTYLVVTSDNGYHLGEHGLGEGKSTAYDHDIRVPLFVLPPGAPMQDHDDDRIVQNVDLLPTFLDIAGAAIPADLDGQSFASAFGARVRAQPRAAPREGALVEFWRDETLAPGHSDPDRERALASIPPDYRAVRTQGYLYVDYSALDSTPPGPGSAEYYVMADDPLQMHNLYSTLSDSRRAELNSTLLAFATCVAAECVQVAASAPAGTS